MKVMNTTTLVASLYAVTILLSSSSVHAVVTEFDDIALDGQGTNPFIRFDLPSDQYFIVGFLTNMGFWDGNSYSFRIFKDAPSNSLILKSNGVGVGTANPEVPLHVHNSNGNAQIRVVEQQATSAVKTLFNLICEECTPGFRFNQVMPNNQTWFFRMLQNGNFSIDDPLTVAKEAEFRTGGNLIIGGTLTESSSRAVKKNITKVDSVEILDKLETLPVSLWSYTHENDDVRHMGPMAEDFYTVFKLGDTNKGIASLDSAGVALAAIKGLHQRLKLKSQRLNALELKFEQKEVQSHALSIRLENLEEKLEQVSASNSRLVELLLQRGDNINLLAHD